MTFTMVRMKYWIAIFILIGLAAPFAFDSSASAQSAETGLTISDVLLTEVGETPTSVTYEALVSVENRGNTDFDSIQRIEYRLDTGEQGLVYIVTELAAADILRFTFRLDLMPGDRVVSLIAGDSIHETQIQVTGSDIAIEITEQRVAKGGVVELDIKATNIGTRTAKQVGLTGEWNRIDDGLTGTADSVQIADAIEVGNDVSTTVSFNLDAGSYLFQFTASTTSAEADTENNAVEANFDVEFVELNIEDVSTEVIRWHSDGLGLVAFSLTIHNVGVDDSEQILIGVNCTDDACSESRLTRSIQSGETATVVLEVWMPVGNVLARAYAGADEDGFRWGFGNVVETSIEIPEASPLEWSLEAVSMSPDIQYWSDGSANVVFETTMTNLGSDLVTGMLTMSVTCTQSDMEIEDCGGEFPIDLDPQVQPNLAQHTVRVPQGKTRLFFSVSDEDPITQYVTVPKRILGVDREIWDCFKDTSFVGQEGRAQSGVGCGGWRNAHVIKWKLDEPIKIWKFGDDDYLAILDRVLDYLAPLLNIEFEEVQSKSVADIQAYVGVPRTEVIDELGCNHAAGCTTFEIGSDGEIKSAKLVVWPPISVYYESGIDHMIYSIALHELVHSLTGMLHRHDDRTSLMSYDSLDYVTLGEIDEALLRIWADPLVEPGMDFNEVARLIVFDDELVDVIEPEPLNTRGLLRKTHAKLMDAGTATFEVSGGWTSCGFTFSDSLYSIGGVRPRAARWIHFNDQNEPTNVYIIRSRNQPGLVEFWTMSNDEWRLTPTVLNQLSFRDSFSNPLIMLSSINLYGDEAELTVIDEDDDLLTIEVELTGADVRTSWSTSIELRIRLQVDKHDYEIPSYEMQWAFESDRSSVCDSYQIEARNGEYGGTFEFPDAVRDQSTALRRDQGD